MGGILSIHASWRAKLSLCCCAEIPSCGASPAKLQNVWALDILANSPISRLFPILLRPLTTTRLDVFFYTERLVALFRLFGQQMLDWTWRSILRSICTISYLEHDTRSIENAQDDVFDPLSLDGAICCALIVTKFRPCCVKRPHGIV